MQEVFKLEENCCEFPELEICDIMELLPAQYQKSKNICSLLIPFMNQLNRMYQSLSFICGIVDCSQLSGDALTNYGVSVGYPRCQCNVKCDNSGVSCIDNDDVYCRLIQAHLISRQGPTMRNLCLAIECLFGEDAFIISSTGGLTQVSSGRPLTADELCVLQAFKNVIPHVCGTSVEIYDIEDFSSIVGVNCGSCNIYAGACEGAETLCNPLTCDLQFLNCPTLLNAQEFTNIDANSLGGMLSGVGPYTAVANGNAFETFPNTGISFIDNSDGTWSITGQPNLAGVYTYDVTVTDALGRSVVCSDNRIFVVGADNTPPTSPEDVTIDCDGVEI